MFGKRVLSSVVLVLIALFTILQSGMILTLTLFAISMVAFYELSKACQVHTEGQKINGLECVGYLAIVLYYIALYVQENMLFLFMMIVFAFMATMFIYVVSFPKYSINQVMANFFSFVYAPVMFSFIYLTREMKLGIYLVWMIFISSWISDTCAYLVGVTMGKHKLAPVLSPKKSIEGSIGGILGSALVGGLFGLYMSTYVGDLLPENAIAFAVISALGSVMSQIGDLSASAIKRQNDIKDYGKLIPGHGGIMDRFDSVIVTSPMIYFMAMLFFMN